jgi:hypothetical protein
MSGLTSTSSRCEAKGGIRFELRSALRFGWTRLNKQPNIAVESVIVLVVVASAYQARTGIGRS